MISKELLSEVLDYDVDKYTIVSSTETTQIRIWKKDAEIWDYRSYDIYHFAHKCKEWAFNKGIILVSGYYPNGNVYCSTNNILKGIFNESRADIEVEAIIKACEWILKEIKK